MHASWLHRIGSNPRALAGASAARAAPCKHGHAPMRAHAVHPRACLTSEPTMRRTQRELLLSSPPPSPTSSSQRLPPACRLLPLRPPPSPRSRRCARRPRAALTVLTRLAAIAALTAVVSRLPAFGQRASAWPAALSPPSHAVVAAVLAAGAPPSPQARRPRRCAHRRRGPCRRPPAPASVGQRAWTAASLLPRGARHAAAAARCPVLAAVALCGSADAPDCTACPVAFVFGCIVCRYGAVCGLCAVWLCACRRDAVY